MAEMRYQQAGSSIKTGYFDKNAFKRREKLLLVLRTGVAGVHFHVDTGSEEGREFLETLVPGTELVLYRDPDNEHDQWAVSVFTKDDQELGYITRFKNETIARLMDYGKKFYAYVDEPRERPKDPVKARRTCAPTERFEIPFSVYMSDE